MGNARASNSGTGGSTVAPFSYIYVNKVLIQKTKLIVPVRVAEELKSNKL